MFSEKEALSFGLCLVSIMLYRCNTPKHVRETFFPEVWEKRNSLDFPVMWFMLGSMTVCWCLEVPSVFACILMRPEVQRHAHYKFNDNCRLSPSVNENVDVYRYLGFHDVSISLTWTSNVGKALIPFIPGFSQYVYVTLEKTKLVVRLWFANCSVCKCICLPKIGVENFHWNRKDLRLSQIGNGIGIKISLSIIYHMQNTPR